MPTNTSGKIGFGAFLLDRENARLTRDGQAVALTPKALDVLHHLANRRDQLVTKDELLDAVWSDVIVSDASVKVCIREIRKALGDSTDDPQFIQTVHRRGYRFISAITTDETPAPPATAREPAKTVSHSQPEQTPVPTVRDGRTFTVGREAEMAALIDAFKSAAGKRGSMVCVTGEPGLGKTTLVEEFLQILLTTGSAFRVARGRCSERLSGAEAYLPLLEALDSLLRGGADDAIVQTFKSVAPAWFEEVVPSGPEEQAGAQRTVHSPTQQRMKRELVMLFEELTRAHPLILFLDDVHWADASTVDMLGYVGMRCAQMPVLIVVTYRPSELHLGKHPFGPVQLELQRHGICRELSLAFLSRRDVDAYLGMVLPGNRLGDDFSEAIHVNTEGNPLFLVDLLRYLSDRGTIAEHPDGWALAQTLPDLRRELPASIRSLIQKKLERLTEPERRLLSAASVQGYAFDSATLARVLNLDAATAEEGLEALERVHRLVRRRQEDEFPDGSPTVRYQFVHVLYQNALFAQLQPARRTVWSAAAAEGLLAHYGDQRITIAGELALLFEAARDWPRAVEHFFLDAQNAMRVAAHHEAAVLARRALEILEKLPDSPAREKQELELLLALGVSLVATRGFASQDVEDSFMRARELCQKADDISILFPVLYGLWNLYLVRAELSRCEQIATQMFELARDHEDPAYRLLGHTVLHEPAFHAGDFATAQKHQIAGLALYDPAKHAWLTGVYGEDPGLGFLIYGAATLWHMGFPDRALQTARDARARAQEMPNTFNLARTLYFGAFVHMCSRDVASVQEWAATLLVLCREQGFTMLTAGGTILLGWTLAQSGEAEEGISLMRQGLADWAATGALSHRPSHLALFAEALAIAGDVSGGLEHLAEAEALCASTGERFHEAEIVRLIGELTLARSPNDKVAQAEAAATFRRAREIADRQGAKSFGSRITASVRNLGRQRGKSALG